MKALIFRLSLPVLLAGAVCLSCSKSTPPDPHIKELEAEIQKLKAGDKSLDSAKKAMRELKKVNSLIEMGIAYPDYNKSLIDTKPAFDEDMADIPESDLKTNLQATMNVYIDAGKFWNLYLQRYDSDDRGSNISEDDLMPFTKYSVPFKYQGYGTYLVYESAVSQIWSCATPTLKAAEKLITDEENKEKQ